MKITELLKPESIELGLKAATKQEVIDRLTVLMERGGHLHDREAYKIGIYAREALGSTAIGDGIAIPHAKAASVKAAGLAAVTVPDGVNYEAFDGSPVKLIFMIAAPEGEADAHLEALAKLSTFLMHPEFKENLLNAATKEEFLQVIRNAENEVYGSAEQTGTKQVLAVTACPTGIAHTFMAAENLKMTGERLGIPVKVETNGSAGADNVLTEQEIREAACIIVAADRNVEMARFHGKPVIQVPVSEGIHHAEELIRRAVSGKVPVYYHEGTADDTVRRRREDAGQVVYRHLMNGVSHMLPFVIGGGILIALAFLVDNYEIDPANFGRNTPIAAYLKTIGDLAFGMMLPVLSGYIAMSIADRPGLAAGFTGGLIAKTGATFLNPSGGTVNAGFLGALFAGFAAGYIVLWLKELCSGLPRSLEGIRPVLIYPVFGILCTAIVTTFINPYVGAVNDGLTYFLNGLGGTSRVILGMIVAGMMSVDMGGPVNKAAYVFGTAQLAEGNYEVMAAVMAGGMVPPLAIALCSTFAPKKFSEKDRQSALVNYIMGLSFITEGAIPFAAADPLRVILSCVAGSAAAGGLSMFFGCTLRAPHGGIFVLPTIGSPVGYLAAVLMGAAIGCIILAMLKPDIADIGKR